MEKPFSPACERNREPILAVLRRWLPASGRLLEIASGTGQHGRHFAAALPGWTWQPSDAAAEALASIAAWRDEARLPNLLAPVALDVCAAEWPVAAPFDAVYCANLIHIAPWQACRALLRGAAARLAATGQVIVYGPFVVEGVATAPSNLAFDADLRARDPAWGLRRLGEVCGEAGRAGLVLAEQAPMPANNLMLRFVRDPSTQPGAVSAASAASPGRARR